MHESEKWKWNPSVLLAIFRCYYFSWLILHTSAGIPLAFSSSELFTSQEEGTQISFRSISGVPSHWTSCCSLCVSPRSAVPYVRKSVRWRRSGSVTHALTPSCPMFCRPWLCTVMRQWRPHRALCMCVTRCVLGRGLPFEAHLYGLHHHSSGSGLTGVTLERPHGYVVWGNIMAAATAAASARREWTCLQALRLLVSSSSLLAHALPTLGSAKSANARQLASSTGSATHHGFNMAIFDSGCIRDQLSSVASGSAFPPKYMLTQCL